MGASFAVRESKLPGCVTIAVEGELDIKTAKTVEDAVQRACAGGCEELVVDLGELTFIDSSGVRALFSAVNACAAVYSALEIVPSRHPAPANALRALGLERRLPWRGGALPVWGPGEGPEGDGR